MIGFQDVGKALKKHKPDVLHRFSIENLVNIAKELSAPVPPDQPAQPVDSAAAPAAGVTAENIVDLVACILDEKCIGYAAYLNRNEAVRRVSALLDPRRK